MSRSPIVVRDACPEDAAALLAIWAELLPSVDRATKPTLADAHAALASAIEDPRRRTLVAEQDCEIIAAAQLIRGPLSPVHFEETVQVSHLYVAPGARRRGAARTLMAAAVAWAEETSATTVSTMAQAHDREANRYLARLGFGSVAVIRVAAVSALRVGTMPVETPAFGRSDMRFSRAVGHIVAQRRAQRRAQAPSL